VRPELSGRLSVGEYIEHRDRAAAANLRVSLIWDHPAAVVLEFVPQLVNAADFLKRDLELAPRGV
jgi:hypothetical protein